MEIDTLEEPRNTTVSHLSFSKRIQLVHYYDEFSSYHLLPYHKCAFDVHRRWRTASLMCIQNILVF